MKILYVIFVVWVFISGVSFARTECSVKSDKILNIHYLNECDFKIHLKVSSDEWCRLVAFIYPRDKNKKDIYDCSNEGIFIACMGLSKRAKKINGNNIDVYLSNIDRNVDINRNEVLKMVSEMMSKPYKGNYLK